MRVPVLAASFFFATATLADCVYNGRSDPVARSSRHSCASPVSPGNSRKGGDSSRPGGARLDQDTAVIIPQSSPGSGRARKDEQKLHGKLEAAGHPASQGHCFIGTMGTVYRDQKDFWECAHGSDPRFNEGMSTRRDSHRPRACVASPCILPFARYV